MAVGRGKDTGSERDVLERLGRAIDRLAAHAARGGSDADEIGELITLTVRTLMKIAEHDLAGRGDESLSAHRQRADAVLRLLRRTRGS